jgi:hypothetical protein
MYKFGFKGSVVSAYSVVATSVFLETLEDKHMTGPIPQKGKLYVKVSTGQ